VSRRLDALFAERVLGCSVAMRTDQYGHIHEECGCKPMKHVDESYDYVPALAPYSENLSAAWGGVEKVGWCELSGPHRGAVSDGREPYWARVEPRDAAVDDSVDVHAGSPAMAVVLACLRAVGVSEEEIAAAEAGEKSHV